MTQNIDHYLDQARVYYDEACGIIREMVQFAEARSRVRDWGRKRISLEMAMWKFDAILQTILLNVAIEDGSFSREDEQFIRRLTQYGDAMVTINEEARKHDPNWKMTWDGIANCTDKFARELAAYAVAVMDRLAEEFAAEMAPIDCMLSRDALGELRVVVLKIMVPMSMVDDGDAEAARNLKSVAVANKLLIRKWSKYLSYTNQVLQKGQTGQTRQTTQTKQTSGESNRVNLQSDKLVNHLRNREIYTNAVIFLQVHKRDYITNGSGVIITRNGYALTCAHVVDGARKLMVKVSNAGCSPVFVRATVHSVDKQNDLAVIKLQEDTYYYAELDLDRKEPVLGENIAIYGYPFGSRMNDNPLELNVSYCRGYVSSNQTLGGKRRTLLDITARSGNSGSPVTSLDNGKVIGIYFGGYQGDPDKPYDDKICGMTPMQYVRGLLNG